MAYGKYKDLTKRTESHKVLKDKALKKDKDKIASNPNYDGYKRGLASMVYKSFDKKSKAHGVPTLANKCQNNNLQMNFINQLLENLKEEQFIHHLKSIFGV